MFKFNQLAQIHLEITNRCQASCPQCPRNINGGLENSRLELEDWTLDQFKAVISPRVMSQIRNYYFCGNYGDPLLNRDLIPMIEWTRGLNPRVHTWIYTNGSLRSSAWWRELAGALPPDHRVVFGIDGLADTHSLYRVGTDFDRVINNAATFMAAGGRAEWAFIRFRHNEHQVDSARAMAQQMGFESFTIKDSGRFWLDPRWPVVNREGQHLRDLEPSTHSEIQFFDRAALSRSRELVSRAEIVCSARANREVYIDSHGQVFPCCFLGIVPSMPLDQQPEMAQIRREILGEHDYLTQALGGEHQLNAHQRPLEEIIDSPLWQSVWEGFWARGQLTTCAAHCGVNVPMSKPQEMFVERRVL
jgi:MoaA/NifB/PqqE/SkfB family radical SAM enzyme